MLKLDQFQFSQPEDNADSIPEAVLTEGLELGGKVSSLNGKTVHSEFCDELASQGVIFGSFDSVLRDHEEIVKKYLHTAVPCEGDLFASLHSAASNSGTILFVPAGVKVKNPFHMLSALGDGGADFGHSLIILEEGAEATVLAESQSTSPDAKGLHCGTIELIVGPNANLRYVNLQNWNKNVWHFARQNALVDANANLQWTIGALGSKLAKVDQHVTLIGKHANAQVNGVMFTEKRQHLAYHTLQHHRAESTTSDLLYKGGLQDRSHLVWRGMIKVDKEAQKTDGYQRNDNLMLTDKARSDSIPGLEIEADDVMCTHGSTTSKVDGEQVFYVQNRGLTRKEATRMVVAGFFQQIFDRITIGSVREALSEAVGRRVREIDS